MMNALFRYAVNKPPAKTPVVIAWECSKCKGGGEIDGAHISAAIAKLAGAHRTVTPDCPPGFIDWREV